MATKTGVGTILFITFYNNNMPKIIPSKAQTPVSGY
jgi:hypothetical protein